MGDKGQEVRQRSKSVDERQPTVDVALGYKETIFPSEPEAGLSDQITDTPIE